MKNNQLAGMLLGLLFLSSLASIGLIYKYDSSLHKLRRLQPEVMAANNARNILQLLLNDSIEYSKTHPEMKTVLQPYMGGGRPATTAAAPAKASK
jgi:hypothetical protein